MPQILVSDILLAVSVQIGLNLFESWLEGLLDVGVELLQILNGIKRRLLNLPDLLNLRKGQLLGFDDFSIHPAQPLNYLLLRAYSERLRLGDRELLVLRRHCRHE